MLCIKRKKRGLLMNSAIPIITRVEFFDTSYIPQKAIVSGRNFSSLTYRKSGRVSVVSRDTSIISEADTLTFVPGGCAYSTEIFESGEMIIMHYQVADGCSDFFDKPVLISPTNKDRILDLFSRALSHDRAGDECACMADAYRIFSEIRKEKSLSLVQPAPRLIRVKQYIDENITSPSLRVSDLAELHKTSEAYFRREFKKYYGESPVEYIKRKRIEIACNLLNTELYSITDIALRAGFDSASYFSYEFKRYMGYPPNKHKSM